MSADVGLPGERVQQDEVLLVQRWNECVGAQNVEKHVGNENQQHRDTDVHTQH